MIEQIVHSTLAALDPAARAPSRDVKTRERSSTP